MGLAVGVKSSACTGEETALKSAGLWEYGSVTYSCREAERTDGLVRGIRSSLTDLAVICSSFQLALARAKQSEHW